MPLLCNSVLSKPTKVDFSFVPLYAGQYEALEKGRLDLVLNADHDTATLRLSKEVIFEVDFVCVVSRKSRFTWAITLKQYLAADHVAVDIIGGVQTHPDKPLAAIGEKRHCPLVVAQHTVAMRVAAMTDMIATVPRRMALFEAPRKITQDSRRAGGARLIQVRHDLARKDANRRSPPLAEINDARARKTIVLKRLVEFGKKPIWIFSELLLELAQLAAKVGDLIF